MHVAELSEKHRGELQLATERALQQWAKDVFVPKQILDAMERVLLFLKQNGGASKQARHVTSLAFVVGEQNRSNRRLEVDERERRRFAEPGDRLA
ncbi:MAG: hypothetical protein QM817_02050 [Archangium sp.]